MTYPLTNVPQGAWYGWGPQAPAWASAPEPTYDTCGWCQVVVWDRREQETRTIIDRDCPEHGYLLEVEKDSE